MLLLCENQAHQKQTSLENCVGQLTNRSQVFTHKKGGGLKMDETMTANYKSTNFGKRKAVSSALRAASSQRKST